MTADFAFAYYRCAPGIVWAKDAGQTMLVETETRRSWVLQDTQVTLWDLLTLDYPFTEIIGFMSVFLGVSPLEAEHWLLNTLQTWEVEGIVLIGDEQHG